MCMRLEHVYSPEMVEAEAGRTVTELAKEFSLSPIVLEYDCLMLIKPIQSDGVDDLRFGMVVADIRHNLEFLPSSFCVHVYREANLVAHRATKFGLVFNYSSHWYGFVPPSTQGFLAYIGPFLIGNTLRLVDSGGFSSIIPDNRWFLSLELRNSGDLIVTVPRDWSEGAEFDSPTPGWFGGGLDGSLASVLTNGVVAMAEGRSSPLGFGLGPALFGLHNWCWA
ncbi:hypothetical protein ACLB2K_068380 [Fragaria x ananassa]